MNVTLPPMLARKIGTGTYRVRIVEYQQASWATAMMFTRYWIMNKAVYMHGSVCFTAH